MSDKILTRPARPDDAASLAQFHAEVFGPGRFARTAYRIRESAGDPLQAPSPFCRVAFREGDIVAAVRFTEITIGGKPGALLLGPLAVAPQFAGQGYGRQLVGEGIEAARAAGRSLVLLVGDLPYYARFGFQHVPPGQITLPGPVDPARLLAVELEDGALARARGIVSAA